MAAKPLEQLVRPTQKARQELEAWIRNANLEAGQRLPSERVLGDRLGVSRTVVRSVLLALELQGLVARHARSGWQASLRPLGDQSLLGQTVAVMVHGSLHWEPIHKEPGWSDFIHVGVAEGLLEADLWTLTVSDRQLHAGGLEQLLVSPPCGSILLEGGTQLPDGRDLFAVLRTRQIPVVALGDLTERDDVDVILSDQEGGSYALTRWLIDRGCRRILRFGLELSPEPGWLRRRTTGFVRACEEAGQEVLPMTCPAGDPNYDFSAAAFDRSAHMAAGYLHRWFHEGEPIDAIAVISDGHVPMVNAACKILGKEPGRDVCVVGYDNYWRESPDLVHEPTPPAATVDKNNREIGHALVYLLLDRMFGRLPAAPQRRVVTSNLIITE